MLNVSMGETQKEFLSECFMTTQEIKLQAQGNIMAIVRKICAKLKFTNFLDMDDSQNTFKYYC